MARPIKAGIDYFPLDVDMDEKFELIEAEYGLTGFGVVVKLFQQIYKKRGYYIEWTDEVALLFAKKLGLGGSAVSEIIASSIKRGMFDRDLYDKYKILTSVGIQKRYFEAVSRRKEIEVEGNILLVNVAQICKNVNIIFKNVNINSENDNGSTQIKEDERKEDERILTIYLPLNNGKNHFVTNDDIDRYQNTYPKINVVQELKKMYAWLEANPKKRKTIGGIERFINGWLSRQEKPKSEDDKEVENGYDFIAAMARGKES